MATEEVERHYRGKRLFDLCVAVLAAVPAIPLALASAIAIRVSSGSPVLFVQERVGQDGRPFRLLKFRTMKPSCGSPYPDRDHITPIGAVLRRCSLDEVPQLLNVMRGEMSIVGPRPTLQYQVDRYDERQRRRLNVRPGLTGLAQVKGRNTIPWANRIELDLRYIESQSLWLDVVLVCKSFHAILAGNGVEGHPSDDPLASHGPPAHRPGEGT